MIIPRLLSNHVIIPWLLSTLTVPFRGVDRERDWVDAVRELIWDISAYIKGMIGESDAVEAFYVYHVCEW